MRKLVILFYFKLRCSPLVYRSLQSLFILDLFLDSGDKRCKLLLPTIMQVWSILFFWWQHDIWPRFTSRHVNEFMTCGSKEDAAITAATHWQISADELLTLTTFEGFKYRLVSSVQTKKIMFIWIKMSLQQSQNLLIKVSQGKGIVYL